MSQTLTAKFDALHAERERTWEPAKLQKNIDQRATLVRTFDAGKVVRVGDKVQPFSLHLSTDNIIDLDELTAQGPVALVFFRFAGCPACNIALPHYDETLRRALEAAGIRLVAVSPHLPERGLDEIRSRHGLRFDVASDRQNVLGRRFGLTFIPFDNPPAPDNDDNWIGALTGTDTWELPQPAIIIIDQNHVVRFADISPDWLRRTEADELKSTLEELKAKALT
jgi:peroxiredoxin